MNYVDIILIAVGVLLVVSGLAFGITSQFMFPIIAGLFGASLLSGTILNWFNSPNQIVVSIVYIVSGLIVSGLAVLTFKMLSLSKDSKGGSRVVGLVTALSSVVFICIALTRTVSLFSSSIDSEFVEAVNQSLLLKIIK